MTDNKLTDNDIKKACKNCLHLEVCLKNLKNAFPDTTQEEINLVLLRENCCKDFIDKDLINHLQTEVERLIGEVTTYRLRWAKATAALEPTRIEAYKECVEKVKEISEKETYCDNSFPKPIRTYHITEEKLDSLLKELVGE